MIFGTWTYTSFMVNLTNSSELVNLEDYNKSGEWLITQALVNRLEFNYDCCPQMKFSKVYAITRLEVSSSTLPMMNISLDCNKYNSFCIVLFNRTVLLLSHHIDVTCIIISAIIVQGGRWATLNDTMFHFCLRQ